MSNTKAWCCGVSSSGIARRLVLLHLLRCHACLWCMHSMFSNVLETEELHISALYPDIATQMAQVSAPGLHTRQGEQL